MHSCLLVLPYWVLVGTWVYYVWQVRVVEAESSICIELDCTTLGALFGARNRFFGGATGCIETTLRWDLGHLLQWTVWRRCLLKQLQFGDRVESIHASWGRRHEIEQGWDRWLWVINPSDSLSWHDKFGICAGCGVVLLHCDEATLASHSRSWPLLNEARPALLVLRRRGASNHWCRRLLCTIFVKVLNDSSMWLSITRGVIDDIHGLGYALERWLVRCDIGSGSWVVALLQGKLGCRVKV